MEILVCLLVKYFFEIVFLFFDKEVSKLRNFSF